MQMVSYCHSVPSLRQSKWCLYSLYEEAKEKGGEKMKETDVKLLAVLLMNTIYNDIRMIVREELERVKE